MFFTLSLPLLCPYFILLYSVFAKTLKKKKMSMEVYPD
jgi:cytochrome bd-type quinol oxidase subunit 2